MPKKKQDELCIVTDMMRQIVVGAFGGPCAAGELVNLGPLLALLVIGVKAYAYGQKIVYDKPDFILHIAPEDSNDGFGTVKDFGRINNDNYDDLVVLAPYYHNSKGGKAIDYADVVDYSDYTFTILPPPAVGVQTKPQAILTKQLYPNYPNPFNACTLIRYTIPKDDFVNLTVYNLLGKEIVQLAHQRQPAGEYEIRWDAGALPNGIYLYKLAVGDFIMTRKAILMK